MPADHYRKSAPGGDRDPHEADVATHAESPWETAQLNTLSDPKMKVTTTLHSGGRAWARGRECYGWSVLVQAAGSRVTL